MKKLLSILLAALCALLPVLALAQTQESTTLKTTIPSEHTITVICGAHGGVTMDGEPYSGTFSVKVARLATLVMNVRADAGYYLSVIRADDPDCVELANDTITLADVYRDNTLTLTFSKLPDPTATPVPEATPEATATAAPDATATAAPEATATAAPEATATPAPDATATAAPEATATATPEATAMPAPDATATAAPDATATAAPEATATLEAEAIYADFPGTGGDPAQTSIVFCGEYQPQDYELLLISAAEDGQLGSAVVYAQPDAEGNIARRSLILSGAQLEKMAQHIESLTFENGDAAVQMQLSDLLEGDVQKLMGLILSGDGIPTAEDLNRDWSAVEAFVLSDAELAEFSFEVRIAPVELADGGAAYEISVWLRWGENELDISGMLAKLNICLSTAALEDEGDRTPAIGFCAADAENFAVLASTPVWIPEEMPEDQADTAVRFSVTVSGDMTASESVCDAQTPLAPYRHSALSAAFAGRGIYCLMDAQ